MASLEDIAEYLLSKVNIYVSGACGPHREAPLDCYTPVHDAYTRTRTFYEHPLAAEMNELYGGGSLRILRNISDVDKFSFVYDIDTITTWRLPNNMAAHEVYF